MNKSFMERLKVDKSFLERTGFSPYYLKIETELGDKIRIEDKEYINLASNNYLGLAADTRVKEKAKQAIDKYGVSLCGTPIATGYIDLFVNTERRLSKFVGLPDTIILPSCYQANNGLFQTIATKDDIIIVDHYAHSSLISGIRAVGCKIRPFLHNDMNHLEEVLKNSIKYKQAFVVTESVFSTEGSIAPFREIVELCSKYNGIPIVDDSHGIGVIGKTGKGILEEAGIENFEGIYTASLGKALANQGGIISGTKEMIDYLRYYLPHLVYSTALTPATLGGTCAVIDIIDNEFESISKKMWDYKNKISKSLIEAGFEIGTGAAPITSIKTNSFNETLECAKNFYDNGILTTPFIEPSVPHNEGRVRLIAGANLTEDTIDKAINIIKKVR
ncbi:MAG TPA: aminotransferase [Clostridiales bacterium]|nr:MAG: aminotransferase [Clostridiales bacterium GWD2_32_59]HAN09673.1 aminotransferase [Clostridiales bacterium]